MGYCFLTFGVTVTTLVAMIVGLYLNQDLPEGLPYDQQFGARFVGANLDISRFLVGFYKFVFKKLELRTVGLAPDLHDLPCILHVFQFH